MLMGVLFNAPPNKALPLTAKSAAPIVALLLAAGEFGL